VRAGVVLGSGRADKEEEQIKPEKKSPIPQFTTDENVISPEKKG
jgi:hypothetical protein